MREICGFPMDVDTRKERGYQSVEKREYKVGEEYSVWEMIRCNLRVWWLMLLGALIGAVFLGGYIYASNRQYVVDDKYEETYRVEASMCVNAYSNESAAERVGTVTKTAVSRSAYEKLIENTGYDLEFLGYQQMFDFQTTDSSDIIMLYVDYPDSYGAFSISDETMALEFAQNVIQAVDETTQELMGEACIKVLDEPYVADPISKKYAFAITHEEFPYEISKAVAAGAILGIIVEVALYTWFLMARAKKEEKA